MPGLSLTCFILQASICLSFKHVLVFADLKQPDYLLSAVRLSVTRHAVAAATWI